ncbi:hypothetical protein E2562_026681 [Oryza meyeriana var. granulata]|uniref:Uncharacterized protein n=1 Tax=Oryza meyeriana var. granulata TaxID=110450 RepID=A0A6G1C088_9ORYZ|nr:hypothetical protein E2562_026681 [Oryza meyeriana var. granulata]
MPWRRRAIGGHHVDPGVGCQSSPALHCPQHRQGGTMVTYGGMSKKPVTVSTSSFIFKLYLDIDCPQKMLNSIERVLQIDMRETLGLGSEIKYRNS